MTGVGFDEGVGDDVAWTIGMDVGFSVEVGLIRNDAEYSYGPIS